MEKYKLIEAIRKTVDDLVNNNKLYNWMECASCNCGVLAQNICNLNQQELNKRTSTVPGIWKETVCAFTGTPMESVFLKMFSVGCTKEDIIHLENLDDGRVLKKLGKTVMIQASKSNLIKYLDAWLSVLEEEEDKPIKLSAKPMSYSKESETKFVESVELSQN